MLDGIGAENFPHRESMQAMPGFSDKLSDEEAGALANYLRVTWGGQQGDVTGRCRARAAVSGCPQVWASPSRPTPAGRPASAFFRSRPATRRSMSTAPAPNSAKLPFAQKRFR